VLCFVLALSCLAPAGRAVPQLQHELLWPGHPASALDMARNAARLEREFSVSRLEDFRDELRGNVTRWTFSPRPGTAFNDVFWRGEVDRPFDKLFFFVCNKSHGFTLAVKIGEQDGSEYTARREFLDPGDWQRIEFPFEEFALASWSKDENDAFDFPLKYIATIAFQLEPGLPYEVLLDDLVVERQPPQQVNVRSVSLPRSCDAGAAFPVALSLSVEKAYAGDDPLFLRLLRDGAVVAETEVPLPEPTDQWLPGEAMDVEARLRVPQFAWGGEHQVQVRIGYSDVVYRDRTDGVMGSVTIKQQESKPVVAEIREHNDAPTLFINGEPDSAMVYMTYHPNSKYFRQFGEHGVHLYSFPSTCSRHTWQGFARQAWLAAGDNFDFSQVDEEILRILEADPDAYVFPRVYVNSPDWWDELHPDQLVLYDDGDGEPKLFHETENKPCPSWASEPWRKDTAYALTRYIQHIRSAPYASRVIGYHVASGTTEEWMYWGANEGKYCDYSRPTLEAFRKWLRRKYRTEDRLRAAWGSADVTFGIAEIPRYEKRVATEHGVFRDPVAARDVIDFQLFLSDLTAETINYFAGVVKKATKGEQLFGTFYGYVLQLFGQRQQNAGHLAPRTVWQCPDVDFLTSPTSYAFRDLGDGYSHFMSLTDSVKLHGKMWFDENDIRTWLTGGPTGQWGKTDTYEETLAMEQREFANVICNACGQWWFDMGGGWYDDPRILEDIGQMKSIADQTVGWRRSPVSQIAFVVDPQSLAYLKTDNQLSALFMLHQLPQLGRCGAPFAYYTLDDIPDIPPQRLYIFANAWAVTDEQRRMIERSVKCNEATALWLYAPGLVRQDRLDEEGMAELTGMRLRYTEGPAPLQVALSDTDDSILAGLEGGTTYGTEQSFAPVVYANDPDAVVLGRLVGSDLPGLVVKRLPGWTSVYSAAPMLPAALLRNLAKEAGAHIFVESDDTVYANASLFSLIVDEAGPRTIAFPGPVSLDDLFAGGTIAENVTELKVDMPEKSARLWRTRARQDITQEGER
jgi:hypothetical protein